ncbi:hypothetical protein D088_810048 [Salmonella enterica subsp. houtenae serovar 16:z4,z32:-- str. RKS3027]|nr:hypothetical protein D088_810048 [Salmonella enterica subsp. houtenae serovar 16:z4,z32:-- str. RKS3027]
MPEAVFLFLTPEKQLFWFSFFVQMIYRIAHKYDIGVNFAH